MSRKTVFVLGFPRDAQTLSVVVSNLPQHVNHVH